MDNPLARLVSVSGHPAVLMPVAAVIASPDTTVTAAVVVSLVCATVVVGYSVYKARRGDWGHIDASLPVERAQLNSRVGLGLLAAAGVLALAGLHAGVSLAVGLSGLIVLAGHVLRSLAKLSLHVAFAVFAAFLVWPSHAAAAGLAAAAVAVGWSRIALRRHVPADIMLGALVGASGGWVFHLVLGRLAA